MESIVTKTMNDTMITKALIIDEPWIGAILSGEKLWEMRSSQTSHRGYFGLIRKGSGQVIGVAKLIDVSGPYDNSELVETFAFHRVDSDLTESPGYKWRYAWQLADVCRLPKPVSYQHKSGAVTWVSLDEEAITAIAKQMASMLGDLVADTKVQLEMDKLFGTHLVCAFPAMDCKSLAGAVDASLPEQTEYKGKQSLSTQADSGPFSPEGMDAGDSSEEISISINLTQGNINNAHFYIPRQTALFPQDAWGGKNKREAGKPIKCLFDGLDYAVETDIDSHKRIFRARGAVREFFDRHQICERDRLQVMKLSDREFRIVARKTDKTF